MDVIVCRDCGSTIQSKARGCQTCALNVEAERMIDRFVIGVVCLILLVATSIATFLFLR